MFYLVFVIFFLFLLLPEVVNVSNPKLIPTYDGWLRLFVEGVHLIILYMLKSITKKSSAWKIENKNMKVYSSMNLQSDPNQKLLFQMAITQKHGLLTICW